MPLGNPAGYLPQVPTMFGQNQNQGASPLVTNPPAPRPVLAPLQNLPALPGMNLRGPGPQGTPTPWVFNPQRGIQQFLPGQGQAGPGIIQNFLAQQLPQFWSRLQPPGRPLPAPVPQPAQAPLAPRQVLPQGPGLPANWLGRTRTF